MKKYRKSSANVAVAKQRNRVREDYEQIRKDYGRVGEPRGRPRLILPINYNYVAYCCKCVMIFDKRHLRCPTCNLMLRHHPRCPVKNKIGTRMNQQLSRYRTS